MSYKHYYKFYEKIHYKNAGFINRDRHIIYNFIPKCASTSMKNMFDLDKRHGYDITVVKSEMSNPLIFAVIREPIDRFFSSMYEVMKCREDSPYMNAITKKMKFVDISDPVKKAKSFINEMFNMPLWDAHLLPQFYYISKEVNEVILFENMKEELKIMCDKYNLDFELNCHKQKCINPSEKEKVKYEILQCKSLVNKIMNIYRQDLTMYEFQSRKRK